VQQSYESSTFAGVQIFGRPDDLMADGLVGAREFSPCQREQFNKRDSTVGGVGQAVDESMRFKPVDEYGDARRGESKLAREKSLRDRSVLEKVYCAQV
jgi:hypothetical protein